ncbi:MAG: PqqD family protein [Candidatus Methanoperedens sp.]
MLEVKESETLKIAEQYVLYKLDVNGGLFWLFNIEEGSCFKLNETSFCILSCFDGKASISKIFQQLLSRYPTENPEKVSNDLKEIVEILKTENILS